MHVLNEMMVACLNKGWLDIYEPFICHPWEYIEINDDSAHLECMHLKEFAKYNDIITKMS